MTPAADHLTFAELADYWTVDLDPAEAERIEAHVFTCALCAGLLEESERLRSAIGAMVLAGDVRAFVTDELLNVLSRDGVRVRTYTLSPGESVHCAAWADDEVMVTRLRADFAGVAAVDAEMRTEHGQALNVVSDIPVREGATELLLAMPAAYVRHAPEAPMRLTLRPSGAPDRVLAEYVFDHQGAHERQ
jgi:hypothetical protein